MMRSSKPMLDLLRGERQKTEKEMVMNDLEYLEESGSESDETVMEEVEESESDSDDPVMEKLGKSESESEKDLI